MKKEKTTVTGIYRSTCKRANLKPLLRELVVRDLKIKYRRSFLGYLWSLLNPLMMMIVMSIVFSHMFRSDIENFPLYLICGNVLFTFLSESTTAAMYSVLDNSPLLYKVYIPKMVFPVSRVLSHFITTNLSLVAVLIVMVFMRVRFYWTLLLVWIPMFLLLLFSLGVSMILSSLVIFVRDLTHFYSIIIMVWMYLTPIFYPVNSSLFPPLVLGVIKCNPLYHFITFFRSLVMYGQWPGPDIWLSGLLWSVVSLAAGLAIFRKLQDRFILFL